MTAFVIPNAIQITTRQAKYTFASFLSRDTTFDVIYNIWRLARPEDSVSFMSSGRGSMDGVGQGGGQIGAGGTAGSAAATAAGGGAVAAGVLGVGGQVRAATQCTCGREGKHYSETAMEVVIPGTPEKIHNLIFASGFIKDFMVGNQKLLGMFLLVLYLLYYYLLATSSYSFLLRLRTNLSLPQTSKCPTGPLSTPAPSCSHAI